jgi:Holliday junction DNA helicase RuvB
MSTTINTEFRPLTFADYSGQEESKTYLQLKVSAFKKTRQAAGHVLFLGPSGLGKTTIATIFANELGVRFHQLMGTRIKSFQDIINIVQNIKENDIVFIDEIHALNSRIQEELYILMEDFAYDHFSHHYGKSIRRTVPRFTLIGATTHAGDLNAPLLARFQDRIELSPYSRAQLTEMIIKAGKRMYMIDIPVIIADNLARLSRRTARHAYSLLKSYMEVVEAMTPGNVTANDLALDLLEKTLRMKRIDPILGLDVASRKYLVAILRDPSPMGIKSLATMINEQESTISYMIEPFLFSDTTLSYNGQDFSGPMARPTKKGRVVTEVAEAYILACQNLQKESGWFNNESLTF